MAQVRGKEDTGKEKRGKMYRDDEGSVGLGPPTGAFQGQRDQRLSLKTFIFRVQGSCDIITSMKIG